MYKITYALYRDHIFVKDIKLGPGEIIDLAPNESIQLMVEGVTWNASMPVDTKPPAQEWDSYGLPIVTDPPPMPSVAPPKKGNCVSLEDFVNTTLGVPWSESPQAMSTAHSNLMQVLDAEQEHAKLRNLTDQELVALAEGTCLTPLGLELLQRLKESLENE